MLVVFGGFAGTGKTTLAQRIAAGRAAAYIRIDAIEAAMWRAGVSRSEPTGLAAYVVGDAIAEGSLRAGTPVVVEAVNPDAAARRGWRELSARTGAPLYVIEVVCSDRAEHRRRVEQRQGVLEALAMPTWADVVAREYEPWHEPRLVVDTAEPFTECLRQIEDHLLTPAGS
jgi:predicted kinase